MQRKAGKLSKIVVSGSYDAPLSCISFFFCHLDGLLDYQKLELKVIKQFLGKNRHMVVDLDFLLATWAVQVAKRYLQRRPFVLKSEQKAICVENVATNQPDARLILKFIGVANHVELVAFHIESIALLRLCFFRDSLALSSAMTFTRVSAIRLDTTLPQQTYGMSRRVRYLSYKQRLVHKFLKNIYCVLDAVHFETGQTF